ncbi:Uu.00g122170.m01.CDS01 [Anthostomella pinea]|uniref:Uu.00g122170.m01.CDS01 n=1 Tax=Anthostomella pinea TaxID=933095 RepID=A0AAI8VH26_9PEZI|nr:Uu.00g122170.m01.CDS01 [Anthostomella pinea]
MPPPPPAGALKSSHTISNLPVPATYYRDSRRASPTNIPSPKALTATSYTTATALPRRQAENIPPSNSKASLGSKPKRSLDFSPTKLLPKLTPKSKARHGGGIPKSRTINVFSNLTSSLSRTSLGNFNRSESRHTSTSSGEVSRSSRAPPYLDSSNAASSSSQALINPMQNFNNPRQIHIAQESAYWTGRFMALQDRFHSELLLPQNLTTLVNAHAERSLLPDSQPTFADSLATSSTTACIQQGQGQKPTRKHQHTQSTSTVGSIHNRASAEAAALLSDEDNRSRRIFFHLEALCTSNEARRSLHSWQQTYARRMGKESLLPRGGCMEDKEREKEKGWMGRLLGNTGAHGKRGSFVF